MSYFALADCNNFYVSCERAFNPALEKTPIVILSNNDGCIICRSNEAKALGIAMGAPIFKYRSLIRQNQVKCLSSNYALYGDMSHRVMHALQKLCPDIEIYSIDEAFLKLDSFSHYDLETYLSNIRQKIKQWTGMPISIGLATTKTLAKVANFYAKRFALSGVYDLRNVTLRDSILGTFPIQNIWGIGQNLTKKLNHCGIATALDLQKANQKIIRKRFSVVIERIILELRGVACLDLENVQPKKQIMCSRSFGNPVTQLDALNEAISTYTARAAVKLREQKAKTQKIYVFITTNKYKLSDLQYTRGAICPLIMPTSDTRQLISMAKKTLAGLYRTGFQYKKVGILLMDIVSNQQTHYELFAAACNSDRADALMKTVDSINKTMGANTLLFAAQGIKQPWAMRSAYRSPRYTTNWQEIVKVIA